MSDISDIISKRRRHATTGNNPMLLTLGEQVRTTRLANVMTQEELALVSGVGRELVIQLENGKAGVTLGKACQVLAALGLQLTTQVR